MEAVKRIFTKLFIKIFKVILEEVFRKIMKMVKDKIMEYYRSKKKKEKDDEKKRDIEKVMEDVSGMFDDIDKEIPNILEEVAEEELKRIEDKTIPLNRQLKNGDKEDDD